MLLGSHLSILHVPIFCQVPTQSTLQFILQFFVLFTGHEVPKIVLPLLSLPLRLDLYILKKLFTNPPIVPVVPSHLYSSLQLSFEIA